MGTSTRRHGSIESDEDLCDVNEVLSDPGRPRCFMGYEPCYQNTSISRNQFTHTSTLRRWLHQDSMPMNKTEDKLHVFTSTSDYLASRISPTNRNIPALWRVILCLIFFPLASFATQSYDPNALV